MRGIAILLVMLRHSWGDAFGGAGIVGVVTFFTLSGYLITGLLANDMRTHGRIRYGRFYRNRAIRLLPALAFMLLGFALIEGLLHIGSGQVPRSIAVALSYTADVPGINHGSTDLSHLWTLANEEQFYLIWPILILVAVRYRKTWLTLALTAAGILAILTLTVTHVEPLVKIYTWPSTWTISMVIGAAGQLGSAYIARVISRRSATVLGLAGLAGLVGLSFLPDAKSNPWVYEFGGITIAVFALAVIWWAKDLPVVPDWVRPIVALGVISYAAYLWNYPITWWLQDADVTTWQIPAIILTIGAATLSWFAVERPFNRVKARLGAPRDTTEPVAESSVPTRG